MSQKETGACESEQAQQNVGANFDALLWKSNPNRNELLRVIVQVRWRPKVTCFPKEELIDAERLSDYALAKTTLEGEWFA